jgi:CBS domain-containing protein
MATQQTDIDVQSRVMELAGSAFTAFCDDMSSMFGLQASARFTPGGSESFAGIKKRVPKFSAVHAVKSDGAINGVFYLVFDNKAIFTLAGSVMMLPKQIILNHTKTGTLKDAEGLRDAVQEIGNLFVGSWDRVFRENFEGHGHFAKGATFVGDIQEITKQEPGFAVDGQYSIADCEIDVGDFTGCHCIVVFPQSIWSGKAEAGATEKKPAEAAKPAATTKSAEAVKPAETAKPADTAKPVEAPKPADTTKPAETPKAETETKQQKTADSDKKPADAGAQNATVPQEKPVEQPAAKPVIATSDNPVISNHPLENIKLGSELSAITAGDIMNRCMIWASPEDSVDVVQALMQQHNTGYVLVGAGGVCQGIISRSNITGAVSPFLKPIFTKWRRPLDDASLQIKVKWIMSAPVHTVSLLASLDAVVSKMSSFGGRCLPVVNADGKVAGIITVFDVFKVLMNKSGNTSVIGEPIQSPPLV